MADKEMSLAIEEPCLIPVKEEEIPADIEMSTKEYFPAPGEEKEPLPKADHELAEEQEAPLSENDAILDIIRKEFEFEEFLKRHEIAGNLLLFLTIQP
jgi:hypothetical protein